MANSIPSRVVILIGIVVTASVAIAVGLAVLGPSMAPVQRGSSHEFWDVAADVQLSGTSSDWGGYAYIIDETWGGYDIWANHGRTVYSVPLSDIESDFDAVLAKLEKAHQAGIETPFVKGFVSWNDQSKDRRDIKSLIESIARERVLLVAEKRGVGMLSGAEEYLFRLQWRQADWYWANFAFEWTFLSSLVLFALWPGIRRLSDIRWGLHVAFRPFLFALPAYLGYARMSLYGGGILYPLLLKVGHSHSCTGLDLVLLKYVPPILEPLSLAGSWLEHTWSGTLGPTSALTIGLWYGGLLIVVCRAYKYWMRHSHQITNAPDSDSTHD